MDNVKDDGYYIDKAVENIDVIISYTAGKTYDEIFDDDVLADAVMFRLIQMAENVNRISKEYKSLHPNIKWGQIIGFRNGIVHEYGKTDYTIVYEIVSSDLYELKQELTENNKR